MKNVEEWNINKNQLSEYHEPVWTKDYLFKPNNNIGILAYNIDEYRMGTYSSHFAVSSNKQNPITEFNPLKTRILFSDDKTFYFLEESDCIAFRKEIFNLNGNEKWFPFVILNIKSRKFSFIEFDNSSIYFGIKEIKKNKVKITIEHLADIKNLKILSIVG